MYQTEILSPLLPLAALLSICSTFPHCLALNSMRLQNVNESLIWMSVKPKPPLLRCGALYLFPFFPVKVKKSAALQCFS